MADPGVRGGRVSPHRTTPTGRVAESDQHLGPQHQDPLFRELEINYRADKKRHNHLYGTVPYYLFVVGRVVFSYLVLRPTTSLPMRSIGPRPENAGPQM